MYKNFDIILSDEQKNSLNYLKKNLITVENKDVIDNIIKKERLNYDDNILIKKYLEDITGKYERMASNRDNIYGSNEVYKNNINMINSILQHTIFEEIDSYKNYRTLSYISAVLLSCVVIINGYVKLNSVIKKHQNRIKPFNYTPASNILPIIKEETEASSKQLK